MIVMTIVTAIAAETTGVVMNDTIIGTGDTTAIMTGAGVTTIVIGAGITATVIGAIADGVVEAEAVEAASAWPLPRIESQPGIRKPDSSFRS
jgi:hypothetical protein